MSKITPVQTDPTQRFQKFEEYTHIRTCVMSFKGYDTLTGIEVTWHELDIRTLNNDQKSKLLEKGDALMNVKFDSILAFLHFWIDNDKQIFYFITESMSSTSIYNHVIIGNATATERVIAKWFHYVLLSIDFLHSCPTPIFHLGISLNSIFVKPSSGHIKIVPPLIDPFYLFQGNNSIKLRLSTPPELLRHEISTSCDIWFFGIALLHAATLIEPYSECKSPNSLIQKLENFVLPECINKVESIQLRDLISRCLKPVDQRATARELLGHPFFKREFEPIPEPVQQNDDAIEVIFTKKSASHSDNQLTKTKSNI